MYGMYIYHYVTCVCAICTQVRPFHALSTGQRARAMLSRGIESGALFDDFTRSYFGGITKRSFLI